MKRVSEGGTTSIIFNPVEALVGLTLVLAVASVSFIAGKVDLSDGGSVEGQENLTTSCQPTPFEDDALKGGYSYHPFPRGYEKSEQEAVYNF